MGDVVNTTSAASSDAPRSAEFERHRDRLFGLAYRMTGSVADAEDALQEAWLRWQRVDPHEVDHPEAFLVRVVTRLAIDRGRSAQVRREHYVGPWLPEPVVEGPLIGDPESAAETADSLTFAFLVLLDRLSPLERAVFLLREVFAFPYEEIATSTGRSAEACRQMISRTRRKLDAERVELRRPSAEHEVEAISRMVAAVLGGDIVGLMDLLSPDVVLLADGGPQRHAARRPVIGAEKVARLCVNLGKRLDAATQPEFVRVNGTPGIVMRVGASISDVLLVEFAPDGRVLRIFNQRNPQKLEHLGRR